MYPTRREFLTASSLMLTGSILNARGLRAQILKTSTTPEEMSAKEFLADTITAADLRALAVQTVDAARSAGARYADVRIAEQIRLRYAAPGEAAILGGFHLMPCFMYGVRTLVDGAWAFVHGVTPSTDALVIAAREAVDTARGYARLGYAGLNRSNFEFAPAPVITGEWETPIQLDPFTVPLGDQAALLSACRDAASRVRNAGTGFGTSLTWILETRIFASTEGSLVTQTFRTFEPNLEVVAGLPGGLGQVRLPVLTPMSGGYECITRPSLQDDIKRIAEEAAEYLSLPRRTMEVGRYPVVFDGVTMGMTLGRTLGCALEFDRVLGYETGSGSGSYLNPPEEVLGSNIASSLIDVTANRESPSITAVKWDDEGIEPKTIPLIKEGTLVNYLTSRQTVPTPQRQQLAGPAGCAVAPDADNQVLIRIPHLSIAPGVSSINLRDLCKDIGRGVLVRDGGYVSVDQQFGSGLISRAGTMLQIEKGKIVRRLERNGIQFTTPRFWKSLSMIGDVSTVQTAAARLYKGQPEQTAWFSTSAPAGLLKDVDIINTRIRI